VQILFNLNVTTSSITIAPALTAKAAIPVAAQPKTLQDQLVGTWTLKSDMHEQEWKGDRSIWSQPARVFHVYSRRALLDPHRA
jgi:hypothetical protein